MSTHQSPFYQKRAEILDRLEQLNKIDAQELRFVRLGRLDLIDHRLRHIDRIAEIIQLYQQAGQLPRGDQ